MFFELKNGKVVVTEQGLLYEPIKNFYDSDHTKGKDRFNKMALYIYNVYDKRSIYRNLSIEERQKLVSKDVIAEAGYWRKAEEHPNFIMVIGAMNRMQFTHKERLLEGVKKKIDDYLTYFDQMTLKEDNHKEFKSVIEASEDLLSLYDKLDQMVNKEAAIKQIGGGESKLFEDES